MNQIETGNITNFARNVFGDTMRKIVDQRREWMARQLNEHPEDANDPDFELLLQETDKYESYASPATAK